MVASIWLHALLDIFKKLNSVFCLTAQMEILCSVLTITSLGCKWPELELCPTPTIKLWLQETPQQPDFLSWAFSYLPPHSTLHEYCWLKGATSRKSIPRPSLEIWILRNQFGTDWLTNDWTLKRLFIFYPRERGRTGCDVTNYQLRAVWEKCLHQKRRKYLAHLVTWR